MFGCVIDKQYDSLSDLKIRFGSVKNQIIIFCSQNMVAYIVNTGFALALKKLSPSLSPNEKGWGQPRDSWGQILRSWGQMNNR